MSISASALRKTVLRSIVSSALLLLSFQPLVGQVSDATLVGAILDPSGAAVSSAQVELENQATAYRRQTRSDQFGHYRFSNVPVGNYAVRVQADGLAAMSKHVQMELGRTLTVNLQLSLADTRDSLDVVEIVLPVDTTTTTLQTGYSRSMLLSLPATGVGTLGAINLSLLGPGVASTGGLGFGVGPSVGGQRPTSNNYMVEGIDINNRAVSGPVLTVSNEAIAEFSIQQNQFPAEIGHGSAGQFNTVLVSGTNQLHGSAYEYFQNRKLNAVDESYRRQQVKTLPRWDQNRFGGTLGGPILRNRIFGFLQGEYQVQGRASASAGAAYAPTTEGMRQLGSMTEVSATNLAVLQNVVPIPSARVRDTTVFGRTIPLGLVNTTGPSYANDGRIVASTDVHVSERDELRGRWISQTGDSIDNSTDLQAFYAPVRSRTDVASLAHVHTFAPDLLSELRLGFFRATEDRPATAHQFPGLDAFPNLDLADLSLSLGSFVGSPQSNRSNLLQVAENLTWARGRHTLKIGYDGRRHQSNYYFVQYQRGLYMYNTLQRFLSDLTPEFGLRAVGGAPFSGDLQSHYAYVADEFRIQPNLTLTAGLRYELVGVPAGAKRQALNSIASVPGVLEFREPQGTRGEFAPRLGIAFSPGRSGRLSLRAGWGMAYDQSPHNMWMNSIPPQFYTMVEAHLERPNQPGFLGSGGVLPGQRLVDSASAARAQTSSWIPDQKRPYAMQWNAGLQHSVAGNYVLEVGYLGTRGVHLPLQTQLNRASGLSGSQGLPTFFEQPSQQVLDGLGTGLEDLRAINTMAQYGFGKSVTAYMPLGNSVYHGMTSSLARRYANGLQFKLAYTWSHNIDDSTAVVASTMLTPRRPQDFFDLRSERADSMLDRRHRLSLGGTWEPRAGVTGPLKTVLNGWRVSGTYIAETGAWGTVRSGVDSNLNGDPVADRTIINPAGDAGRSSAVSPLRNSTGSIVGYLVQDPTARYIQAGVGSAPNGGRNTLRLPGINNVDLSLGRSFKVAESVSTEFRVEAYNAFNHAQFVPGFTNSADLRPRVSAAATSMLLTGNALFNRPDLALESNSRQLQLVLRVSF